MKLKMIVLLLACTIVLMTTGCATVDWLLEDTSEPVPATEPVAEKPKPASAPAPVPAPKAVVEPKPLPTPAPQKTYQIGSRGPAGGLIVYDKGEDTSGWRYLELAPVETEFAGIGWGGSGTLVGNLKKDMGSGLENTRRIVGTFGSKEPTKGNTYPAKMCDDLVYGGYSDWFLPSKDELSQAYTLISKGLDDFTDPGNQHFWTSSEENPTSAWYFVGIPGGHGYSDKGNAKILTRAMRRFSGQALPTPEPAGEKTYQVGSKGPAGGFVVYDKGSKTDGWRYLELAPIETEFAYIEWGGIGTLVGELQKDIGSGLENTRRIVSVFGPKEPKRGNNYPAKMCDDLVFNGYSDWFLPSIEELKLVHTNLIAKDLGDIADPNMHSFWSSNEQAAAFAWYMTAANGSTSDANRDFKNKSRAMRRF